MYAAYASHMIATLVRRGSQVHHVFQIGRAQAMPVTIVIAEKPRPISTDARPSVSHFGWRERRYAIPATTASPNETNDPRNEPRCT